MFNQTLRSFSSLLKTSKKSLPVSCNPENTEATNGKHTGTKIIHSLQKYEMSDTIPEPKKNSAKNDWWIN